MTTPLMRLQDPDYTRSVLVTPDWASLPHGDHEFFWGNLGLAEKTSEHSDFDLAVHGNDAALGNAFHHDVAATLPDLLKPGAVERALNLCAADVRQLRHVPAQAR
jgi:hypothetical protein